MKLSPMHSSFTLPGGSIAPQRPDIGSRGSTSLCGTACALGIREPCSPAAQREEHPPPLPIGHSHGHQLFWDPHPPIGTTE